MEILLLRFDAPLMSFGGVMVDQHGPTERFPGVSLLAGLFGNALGHAHGDAEALVILQNRIDYAARWDIAPEALLDYHTVDLGQEKMCEPGWTTHGFPEHRAGGDEARYGTHIRYRHYWANGVMTLAVTLKEVGDPSITALAKAIAKPARPLFIGRKTCLPAMPLLLGRVEADNVLEALRRAPLTQDRLARRNRRSGVKSGAENSTLNTREACWPAHLGESPKSRVVSIYDRRDWRNQIHAGRRLRVEGWLEMAP